MKLTELDPHWLLDDEGRRVGFIFKCPIEKKQWYQSCKFIPLGIREQWRLMNKTHPDQEHFCTKVQPCNPEMAWTCTPEPEEATFENLTITPSIDGSAGGLWHGYITNGEIR